MKMNIIAFVAVLALVSAIDPPVLPAQFTLTFN